MAKTKPSPKSVLGIIRESKETQGHPGLRMQNFTIMAEEKVGDIVYIETNDYLCPMRVNGYKDGSRQKVLSLVYLEGPKKDRSEFVKVEDIIHDTEAWYEEEERKELNEKLRNFFKTADLDLMTCRVLAQIVKPG